MWPVQHQVLHSFDRSSINAFRFVASLDITGFSLSYQKHQFQTWSSNSTCPLNRTRDNLSTSPLNSSQSKIDTKLLFRTFATTPLYDNKQYCEFSSRIRNALKKNHVYCSHRKPMFILGTPVRVFSSGEPPTTTTECTKDDRQNRPTAPKGKLGKQPITPMDPGFVHYLKGDDDSVIDDNNNKDKQQSRTRKILSTWTLSGDRDRELVKFIQRNQAMKKEQARLKTAKNVYRALIGNVIICVSKFGAWLSSGSSAMLAEFIHSVVDCGNQSLLLIGLRDSRMEADRRHPYGYGKSVYFWALVSALGTFFLGAGVSMTHAVGDLMDPSLHQITWEVWAVLGLSFVVDGYVLHKTIIESTEDKPNDVSYWKHFMSIRDPAVLAVLLEDGAACLGIVLAIAGIVASHATANPVFDGVAGVGISALLGAMGIALVGVNRRFLLGQAVDKKIVDDIGSILLSRRSIDSIRSIQSQWTGPETFSYKAEVDFDGTYLAAKLMPIYHHEFMKIRDSMDQELQVLLALYAEDVMRTVEREVRHVETQIRKKYPGAEYIELEPMSVDADRLAIDDNLEAELRRVESDALNRYLKSLRKEANMDKDTSVQSSSENESTADGKKLM